MFCVIDIESTGGKLDEEGIIEIALFKFDGYQIQDQIISLIHPENREIQPYVTKLTGISPNMVKRAPRFYELAKRIIDITKDNVLVAHNAEFDFRMLQNEFSRLGYDFNMPTIDTITWAKKLIPDLPAYGLEKVCASLGINHTHKHRAEGDARATLELFKILLEKDVEKVLMSKAFHEEENTHAFKHIVEPLKNTIGIYYLLNKKGKVIYVGRSNFLKNRIDRHFMANNVKAIELQNEVIDIAVEETGNEVLSRMKEYVEWKSLKPKYNSRKFDYLLPYGIAKVDGKWDVVKSGHPHMIWYCQSHNRAKELAATYCVHQNVDPSEVFVDKTAKIISKKIKSMDLQIEKPKKVSFEDLYFPSKNFVVEFNGRTPLEKCVILVKNKIPRGYAFMELETQVRDINLLQKRLSVFPRDVYIRSLLAYAMEINMFEEYFEFSSSGQS